MSYNNIEIVTIMTIQKFCQQEELYYQKGDWISTLASSAAASSSSSSSSSSNCNNNNSNDNDLIADWTTCRSLMITWFGHIVEYLKMNTNTIEIAISHVDRCMMAIVSMQQQQQEEQNEQNKMNQEVLELINSKKDCHNTFQLLCITCLYTAAKVNEPTCFDPTLLSKISRNQHSVQEIEKMELIILNLLNWYVNPPTTMTFIYLYMDILQQSQSQQKSNYFTSDYEYESIIAAATTEAHKSLTDTVTSLSTNASIVAYCALMNILELYGSVPIQSNIAMIGYQLATTIGIKNCNDPSIIHIQDRLYNNNKNSNNSNSNNKKIQQKQSKYSSQQSDTTESNVTTATRKRQGTTNVQTSPCRVSDHNKVVGVLV